MTSSEKLMFQNKVFGYVASGRVKTDRPTIVKSFLTTIFESIENSDVLKIHGITPEEKCVQFFEVNDEKRSDSLSSYRLKTIQKF